MITRRREQAGALRTALERKGARVVELPTIALLPPQSWNPLDRTIRRLESYDWAVFTSANGVEKFVARLRRKRGSVRTLKKVRIAAIGPATARALKRYGLRASVIPEEYRAEGLLAALRGERWRGKQVLLARAARARAVLPRELRRRGAHVDVVEAYRTVVPRQNRKRARALFARRRPDMITFTSSSTVRNFFALLGRPLARRALAGVGVASIGPITSRTARALGLRVAVEANPYTVGGLVRAIENYVRQQRVQSTSSKLGRARFSDGR